MLQLCGVFYFVFLDLKEKIVPYVYEEPKYHVLLFLYIVNMLDVYNQGYFGYNYFSMTCFNVSIVRQEDRRTKESFPACHWFQEN